MTTAEPLVYSLAVGAAGRELGVQDLSGRETLSTPFRFVLRLEVEGQAPRPEALLEQPASLHIRRAPPGGSVLRTLDGVITEAVARATYGEVHSLRLVLEPRVALAAHRRDVRVFRDRTVPEIVTEVLAGVGVAPVLRLRETYPKRAYCVQYRETDLAFVRRLLEDEGIFTLWGDGDVLVLGDSWGALEPLPPSGASGPHGGDVLPYRRALGLDRNDEAVIAVGRRAALAPGRVLLRDVDLQRPRLDLDCGAVVPNGGTTEAAEVYVYPGTYGDPREGERRARLRAEAIASAARTVHGTSTCPRLAPGRTFRIIDAGEVGDLGELVVTAVEHAWSRAAGGFASQFEALPRDVPLRPRRVTPIPRIRNVVTGVVTGPPGQDIHTDAFGRVKVHFPWDRRMPLTDECSDWIPVVQDATGQSSSIPRVGWGVLVHFVEGDPDRPVVLGRIYDGADPFPVTLPDGKTRTAIKSLSSPSRKGTNEIELDDRAGHERIQLFAERDQSVLVARDKRQLIENSELAGVQRDETAHTGRNAATTVGADAAWSVAGSQTVAVGGSASRFVGANEAADVSGRHVLAVGGVHTRLLATHDTVTAASLHESVGGVLAEASLQGVALDAGRAAAIVAAGAVVEIAAEGKSETAGRLRTEVVGGLSLSKAGGELHVRADGRRTSRVGGSLTVRAETEASLIGARELSVHAGDARFAAAKRIVLRVGDTSLTLEGEQITLAAPSKIAIEVEGESALGAEGSKQN